MRVLLDARPLQNTYASRGIGTVVRNLYRRFASSPGGIDYCFCGQGREAPLAGVRWQRVLRPQRYDWIWEQILWPIDVMRLRASLLVCPVALGPLRQMAFPLLPAKKGIAFVYDLNPLRDSACAHVARTRTYRLQLRALEHAAAIVTISRYVAADLVDRLGLQASSITCIECGVDDEIREVLRSAAGSVGPAEPFLLALGEGDTKNIATVVRVFERASRNGFRGSLKVVGRYEEQTAQVRALVAQSQVGARIAFTGFVATQQLVELYRTCTVFLFPSRCEGFGLPVIEAQACGAPVIVSNRTSLPEAAGPAAPVFDPDDVAGMCDAVLRYVNDPGWRSACSAAGRSRAALRTWDGAARTLEALFLRLGSLRSTPAKRAPSGDKLF